MENSVPYEIIGAPAEVWFAPADTAEPILNDDPAAPWAKVGTSGNLNHAQDGVRISMPQTVNEFRAAGDTGTRKAFRTESGLSVALTLHDMSLEQLALALNGNTVATVPSNAGIVGYKKVGLSRGSSIGTVALLVRWPSPYMDDGVSQLWCPRAMQVASSEFSLQNGTAAGVALEWKALIDTTAVDPADRYGTLKAQTTADET
jgi:hypothetical protein